MRHCRVRRVAQCLSHLLKWVPHPSRSLIPGILALASIAVLVLSVFAE